MQHRHQGLMNDKDRESADDKRRSRTSEQVSADDRTHSPS
jgi:hypothetical protein